MSSALPSNPEPIDPPMAQRYFWQPANARERWPAAFWSLVQHTLFRFSPPATPGFRRMLLRGFGANIGQDAKIHPTCHIDLPWRLTIGRDSCLEHGVRLDCGGTIRIGAHVAISQYVHLSTLTRDVEIVELSPMVQPIEINDGVWLGADVYVAANVRIGQNTVVGARSTVTEDLPASVIAVGHPAKVIRQRSAEDDGESSK